VFALHLNDLIEDIRMCKCDPTMRTPFCGKEGCQWPEQIKKEEIKMPDKHPELEFVKEAIELIEKHKILDSYILHASLEYAHRMVFAHRDQPVPGTLTENHWK
jgi:hypothetical protein